MSKKFLLNTGGSFLNKTKIIIEELKKRNTPSEIKQTIFPIVEQYIDRIQFVKSFVGLKDILYFEELDVDFFDFPFFLSLNCQTLSSNGGDKHASIASVYENAITDAEEIVRKLKHFFEETNRILFFEVAFSENVLSNDDMWQVYHNMNEETDKEPFEIMTKMYRYPEWYDVEFGENVAILEDSLTVLKQMDNINTLATIKELEEEINKALENDDAALFSSLVKELKVLKKQIH